MTRRVLGLLEHGGRLGAVDVAHAVASVRIARAPRGTYIVTSADRELSRGQATIAVARDFPTRRLAMLHPRGVAEVLRSVLRLPEAVRWGTPARRAAGDVRSPPLVVRSARSGDRPRSRPRLWRDCRNRGKGIASPDQPREPKQSWRPQGPTGLDVRDHDRAPSLLNPDSEQAGPRSCVGIDRTDGRRDLDHVAAARLGRSGHLIAAAIRAAPFRPFRQRPIICRIAVERAAS